MSAEIDIAYRPRGRISGARVGAHPSRAAGSLGVFRDQVPFTAYPDARQIDVRATLRDPFENTVVRRYQQRAAVDVYALVDLSRSLDYEGKALKSALAVQLCAALARAATRIGDRFGLIGCDGRVREDCFIPAAKRRGVAAEVMQQLANAPRDGRSAEGLIRGAERLVGPRKMIFLVSDFFLPLPVLQGVFESLARHDVVPVLISDSSEGAGLPDWGLMELADLETGVKKLVFMRPKLKQLWRRQEAARRAAICHLAQVYGRTPVVVADALDIDRFSRALLET